MRPSFRKSKANLSSTSVGGPKFTFKMITSHNAKIQHNPNLYIVNRPQVLPHDQIRILLPSRSFCFPYSQSLEKCFNN